MDNQVSKSAEQVADAVSGSAECELQPIPLTPWEDPRVKVVYDILCDDRALPNPEEHWEGFLARRIVDALFPAASPVAGVKELDEDSLVRIVYAATEDSGIRGRYLYECWQDGISVDRPRPTFLKIANAILAQPSAEGDGWIADGVSLIAAERKRQVESEGWTPAHDDKHRSGELVRAGLSYGDVARKQILGGNPNLCRCLSDFWPSGSWGSSYWKPVDRRDDLSEPADPKDTIRNLVKAGALIAAEIDRLKRLPTPPSVQEEKGRNRNGL